VRRCLGLLFVLLALVPSAAAAHSTWVKTSPEDGVSIAEMPAEATVTVSEEPQKADAVLAGPDGKVAKLTTRTAGSTITMELPANGPRGSYTLSYRVVSADGHPVSGSTTFTVTTGPAPSAPVPKDDEDKQGGEPAQKPAIPVVLGIAILGVAATVFAARAVRR
jgi:methionine-rich copper-binding protein CopC